MKKSIILFILAVFIFIYSCKKEFGNYTKIPDYISNPTAEQKTYFEVYDKVLKQWGVTYEELYIPTSHGIAHVVVSGPKKGIPLVLLHGLNASSTMWYPNAKTLSKKHRIFAIDLLVEPGKSYMTTGFNSIDEITAWYQEILWALKLDSFHLIGASRGGWFAIDLALNSKKEIRSIVLLSPAQTFMWIPPSVDLLKNIGIFSSKEKQTENTLETMSRNVENIDKNYLQQFYMSMEKDSLNKFMMQMIPFSKKDLQNLKMPVLVLIGDSDIINTKTTIQQAEKHLARGKGEIIPNAGHFLSVDQAATVNKKISKFLKEVDATK